MSGGRADGKAAGPWLILLSHGSRDARWRRPLESLARRIAQAAPDQGLSLAYLQHCGPDLEQALGECQAAGARRVMVIPVFISSGGHILRDVPNNVAASAERFPELEVAMGPVLGEEEVVLQAMAQACLRLAE